MITTEQLDELCAAHLWNVVAGGHVADPHAEAHRLLTDWSSRSAMPFDAEDKAVTVRLKLVGIAR